MLSRRSFVPTSSTRTRSRPCSLRRHASARRLRRARRSSSPCPARAASRSASRCRTRRSCRRSSRVRIPRSAPTAVSGIDDPAATIRADVSPLGFHASIRSPQGNWYIDPSSKANDDAYVVYYTRDLPSDPDGPFEFKEGDDEALAAAAVELSTNGGGPSAGDVLRTYRLALVTDQSYATYFGAANVTAAKVALMNRVNQVYEDETSIRLVLINDTDKTNLNTDADAIGANGPCGSAAVLHHRAARRAVPAARSPGTGSCSARSSAPRTTTSATSVSARRRRRREAWASSAATRKARGCTGLPNPGATSTPSTTWRTRWATSSRATTPSTALSCNCAGNNRNGGTAVEPGSGSSIMAYAGICRQDDLQPHSDPYWSQRSFEEISNYVTPVRPPINEVQTASLRDFDGTDSFKVELNGAQSATITNGTNYSAAGIQVALQGVSEIQTVALVGYDGTDSYTLEYKGATTVPIVRGQNNTAAGIQNALQGGNEQQQAVLTGFNATTQSFQIAGERQHVGALRARRPRGLERERHGPDQRVARLDRRHFGRRRERRLHADVRRHARRHRRGGDLDRQLHRRLRGHGAGVRQGRRSARRLARRGHRCRRLGDGRGLHAHVRRRPPGHGRRSGLRHERLGCDRRGHRDREGRAGHASAGRARDRCRLRRRHVQHDRVPGHVRRHPRARQRELAELRRPDRRDRVVRRDRQGRPDREPGLAWSRRPATTRRSSRPRSNTRSRYRTPFALTGSATDADGDTLTYLWEQNDNGVGAGTALVNPSKTNGPIFRQFGTALDASIYNPKQLNSPGENHVTTDPTRTFPDLAQILINNTNAVTGDCPGPPIPPSPPTGGTNVPQPPDRLLLGVPPDGGLSRPDALPSHRA